MRFWTRGGLPILGKELWFVGCKQGAGVGEGSPRTGLGGRWAVLGSTTRRTPRANTAAQHSPVRSQSREDRRSRCPGLSLACAGYPTREAASRARE